MNLIHPTLLLDKQRCKANISRMKKRADDYNLTFKPHFKTHQSKEVGRWFREEGTTGITVSSIAMAHYFAKDGWNDITIAFPVNPLALDEINNLAKNLKLTLLVDNEEV